MTSGSAQDIPEKFDYLEPKTEDHDRKLPNSGFTSHLGRTRDNFDFIK